jgi:hypothetical protein
LPHSSVSKVAPDAKPATSEDIRQLTKRIEGLEKAIRDLTEELSRQRLTESGLQP